MSDKTKIEWTDATWNPIRGCSRVSDGCRHCYAEGVAKRFSGPGQAYGGLVHLGKSDGKPLGWNGNIRFVERHLLDPLRWKKPRRIFVNSMSDLFHENVTDEMRDRIFAVMALSPQHTFQVLTKRPERMLTYLTELRQEGQTKGHIYDMFLRPGRFFPREKNLPLNNNRLFKWPLPNVWLGVSVENQQAADERIPLLLQTPAAMRFLSCEPLLGPVYVGNYLSDLDGGFGIQMLHGIDWVIAGGESGRGARPMHPDWARSLRDQCVAAGVPFFFKQWGDWIPWEQEQMPCWVSQHGKSEDHHALFPENIADDPPGWDSGLGYEQSTHAVFQRVGKRAAGHLLDGVEHHAFPEVRA